MIGNRITKDPEYERAYDHYRGHGQSVEDSDRLARQYVRYATSARRGTAPGRSPWRALIITIIVLKLLAGAAYVFAPTNASGSAEPTSTHSDE